MKRKLSLILLVILIITVSLTFAACQEDKWVIIKEPSCTELGKEKRICIHENQIHSEERDIPALGHAYLEWVVLQEATLENEGVKQHTCNRCGHKESAIIPQLEPTFCIYVYDEDKVIDIVKILDNGAYMLQQPHKQGYAFEGFVDENGREFAQTGTVNGNVSVYTNWSILPTSTFEELQTRALAGAKQIYVVNDIELKSSVFIVDNTEIYVDNDDIKLTRTSAMKGDMFIVGEDYNGNNIQLDGKNAILTLKTYNGGSITIDGNKNNAAEVSGSALLLLNGGKVNMYDNITITNCRKVTNDKLLQDKYKISYPDKVGGAAICVANGTFNMFGGVISNCEVNLDESLQDDEEENLPTSSCGGAIFNYGEINIYNGTICNNQAARGGAIYNYRKLIIREATINDNYASVYGGAVYLPGSQYSSAELGVVHAADTSVKLNFNNNRAERSGGALFGQMKNTITVLGETSFFNNVAVNYNGGAINTSGALKINYAVFAENSCASKGGAIYAYYSNSDLTVRMVEIADCDFRLNSASKGGAIVFSASDVNFDVGATGTVTDTVFYKNNAFATVTEDPELPGDDNGVTEGSKNFNGNGGAVYIARKSSVTFDSVEFIENTADRRGGAIYITGESVINMDVINFKKNSSVRGGAAFLYDGSVVTINAITATENSTTAPSDVSSATTDYNGAVFAVYGSATKLSIEQLIANGNTSFGNGGVMYISASTVDMNNVIVNNNNSLTGNGGAFAVHSKGVFKVEELNADGNSAADNGGTIYANSNADIYVFTMTVNNSCATSDGGVIYTTGSSVLKFANIVAVNNNADRGGVIYATSKSTLFINNIQASQNSASVGGFMYITSGGTTATINSGNINNNSAQNGGNAIWFNVCATTIVYMEHSSVEYVDEEVEGAKGINIQNYLSVSVGEN